MPIFEILDESLTAVPETSFGAEGVLERNDLQRLLRENIAVLDDSLMFIAEEFGDWVDSRRRIDLLGLDRDANLVVIELKRTEDGGHMELQALRYASMVSTMTFDQLVDAHSTYLRRLGLQDDARKAILDFLPDSGKESFG
jgi:RecB family endonuclease NucS